MDQAAKGLAALEAKNPSEALSYYTKALIEHPTSPDYFVQRSTAFTRLSPPRHDLALQDAERAVLYAHQRSKRDKIQAAQHRRAVSLYSLGRYADSKHVLESMKKWLKDDDKKGLMQIDMWLAKSNNRLKDLEQEQTVTVEEKPTIELPREKDRVNILKRQLKPGSSYNFDWESESNDTAMPDVPPTAMAPQLHSDIPTTTSSAPSKIRHEWYQNADSVIVTLYAKAVPKDKAEVDIQTDSMTISFPHPSNPTSTFSFTLDPLYAAINPTTSTHRILSTKVEITLKKSTPGPKWSALEGTERRVASESNGTDSRAKAAMMTALQQDTGKAPAYPTSSKSGPKNWDKVASDLTKSHSKKSKSSKSKSKSTSKSTATNDPSSNTNPTADANQASDSAEEDSTTTTCAQPATLTPATP